MVRIDMNSGGAVSVRELDQAPLDDSMRVLEVPDRRTAALTISTCCKQTYDDPEPGYAGYVYHLPEGVPADDALAAAQAAFAEAARFFDADRQQGEDR
jgi:hypothetical protein